MDTKIENYLEKWNALRDEYDAKADRLDAEKRLEYNDAFEDFDAEVAASADWTQAAWDEFVSKVDRKWQEMAIAIQENNED